MISVVRFGVCRSSPIECRPVGDGTVDPVKCLVVGADGRDVDDVV